MAVIHQSDIGAWTRCPQQYFLERSGHPGTQTSALSYGTVMHHAIDAFEQMRAEGRSWAEAKAVATETFRYYWHPLHMEALCPPVELWLPTQSYAGMARSGVAAIEWYADVVKDGDDELLATEYGFQVPIEGTWDYDLCEPHILAGTADQLRAKYYKRRLVLSVDDLKTGKDYTHLRQNLQFTAYCYASTRREFWVGWRGEDGFGDRGEELHQRFKDASRRGTWISLKSRKFMDAGWRGPDDYERFALAVEQVVASIRADIYPLSLSGENCTYCPQRRVCAGVGVPAADHGAPTR